MILAAKSCVLQPRLYDDAAFAAAERKGRRRLDDARGEVLGFTTLKRDRPWHQREAGTKTRGGLAVRPRFVLVQVKRT
jgi:hypothetical protein